MIHRKLVAAPVHYGPGLAATDNGYELTSSPVNGSHVSDADFYRVNFPGTTEAERAELAAHYRDDGAHYAAVKADCERLGLLW